MDVSRFMLFNIIELMIILFISSIATCHSPFEKNFIDHLLKKTSIFECIY
jgi:hypothetical protein